MIEKREFYFYSENKVNRIHCLEWIPEGKPIAILQLAHGMVEFIDRYDSFARYMAERGFYVVGNDHAGHGKSVSKTKEWGYFSHIQEAKEAVKRAEAEVEANKKAGIKPGAKLDNSVGNVVLLDMDTLLGLVKKKYPGLPYFLLGHSMGSFFARKYACIFGYKLSGLIISGTGNQQALLVLIGKAIVATQRIFFGEWHRSNLLAKMTFDKNNQRIANPVTKNDWLTKDTEIVKRYNEESANNFLFTLNANQGLLDTVGFVTNGRNVAKTPRNLPILFVSGEEDPIGEYGAAVQRAYFMYQKIHMKDVQLKLWPNDRHEILNETDRQEVYEYIYQWLQGKIKTGN